jgi:hypothetical protein
LEIWKPASTNQIANAARLEVSKTSSLLNRLLNRGAIELVKQPGKKKYYQVSERLFNIYYLMRKRGVTDDRVKVVVDFMSIFYPDLIEQAQYIIEEAYDLPIMEIKDHLLALRFIIERIPGYENEEDELFREIFEGIQKLKNKQSAFIFGFVKALLEHVILSAAKGHASEQLPMLTALTTVKFTFVEEILEATEALIVGLKIYLGEERPLVTQEIFEMGKDIADQIRAKQSELAKSREI